MYFHTTYLYGNKLINNNNTVYQRMIEDFIVHNKYICIDLFYNDLRLSHYYHNP